MKNVLIFFVLAFTSISISSCKKPDQLKKTYSFENSQLTKKNVLSFDFVNSSESQEYDIILQLLVTPDFEYNQAIFDFKFKSEQNDSLESIIGFYVRNKNRELLGTAVNNMQQIEQTIIKKRRLPLGTNKFSFTHAMENDTINFINEIEFQVIPSK